MAKKVKRSIAKALSLSVLSLLLLSSSTKELAPVSAAHLHSAIETRHAQRAEMLEEEEEGYEEGDVKLIDTDSKFMKK